MYGISNKGKTQFPWTDLIHLVVGDLYCNHDNLFQQRTCFGVFMKRFSLLLLFFPSLNSEAVDIRERLEEYVVGCWVAYSACLHG